MITSHFFDRLSHHAVVSPRPGASGTGFSRLCYIWYGYLTRLRPLCFVQLIVDTQYTAPYQSAPPQVRFSRVAGEN